MVARSGWQSTPRPWDGGLGSSTRLACESERQTPMGPALAAGPIGHLVTQVDEGGRSLIRVDQVASAVRTPGPWLAPAQVPSRLSPVPPAKNGPPQSV